MLDVSRHFFPPADVKRLIDLAAYYKLNRFNLGQANDQGWRLEIKKYPRLVEVGSKRNITQVGGYISPKRSKKPHEGYYTQ